MNSSLRFSTAAGQPCRECWEPDSCDDDERQVPLGQLTNAMLESDPSDMYCKIIKHAIVHLEKYVFIKVIFKGRNKGHLSSLGRLLWIAQYGTKELSENSKCVVSC